MLLLQDYFKECGSGNGHNHFSLEEINNSNTFKVIRSDEILISMLCDDILNLQRTIHVKLMVFNFP